MEYWVQNGCHYNTNGDAIRGCSYRGLFNFMYGSTSVSSRFGYNVYGDKHTGDFYFNLPSPHSAYEWYDRFRDAKEKGWAGTSADLWNQTAPEKFHLQETIYLTVVFDGEGEKEYLYINGNESNRVSIDQSYWDGFLYCIDELNIHSILLGAGLMNDATQWHLSEMNCYAIRLYSKALTPEEVSGNYLSTVSYHSFLENVNN